MVIRSFADSETKTFWETGKSRRKPPPALWPVALRKLLMLDSARALDDLRVPPGNRLEKRTGNRRGKHTIRINEQYRICFVWSNGDALAVEIVDYH